MASDTSVRPLRRGRSSRDMQQRAVDDGRFAFGIEEEYFLANARTMQVPQVEPDSFFAAARAAVGEQVGREFLQPQVEVHTRPHVTAADARSELVALRQALGQAAAAHGLAIMAAGTHPTALWRDASHTPKERYIVMMDGLQMIGQRNMLCGMHVHVELPDPGRRVDVMRRLLPYLPLLLALSTSSPFWQSRVTGLKGYRLAAYDELPRTGLPDLFRDADEYEAYVAALVRSGVIEDATHIWWAIRPSLKLPTLELRIPDSCTLIDDSVAIAALYRALVRHLCRHPTRNADLGAVSRAIAVENKWRAQRYGVQGTFVTEAGAVTVADLLEQVIEATAADAEALGCAAEIAHCRTIIARGTSADAQLAVYEARRNEADPDAALRAVAEWIIASTLKS